MQETNQIQNEVKNICERFRMLLDQNECFTQDHIVEIMNGIEERVLPLLEAQKPKVMVYGIYNSGKSTLVNAICKKEVAAVADRPMTDKITEYDEGRYILIDSPGVNAPIRHEEIADSQLAECHMILFVISSKGIFEDRMNYQKMLDLINRNLPFYIILNERSEALPSKENGAVAREQAKRMQQEELNNIKRKIIKNLTAVSGRKDIGDTYEVIVLNAKRAWNGIVKENDKLYQKSNLPVLINRIDAVLEGRGALKKLFAPLSALEELVSMSETFLLRQTAGEDFAIKRETLNKKIMLFKESFLADVRMSAEKQFESLYNSHLGISEVDMDALWEEMSNDIEASYMNLMHPLNRYMKEAFSGLGLQIDDRCNIGVSEEEAEKTLKGAASSQKEGAVGGRGENIGGGSGASKENFGSRQGSVLLDAFLNLFKSRRKKEQEEYERLSREVSAHNAEISQRLEEDIRRRQDARTYAYAQIDSLSRQFRLELSKDMDEKFSLVMSIIDREIQNRGQWNDEVARAQKACENLKRDIYNLRQRIG